MAILVPYRGSAFDPCEPHKGGLSEKLYPDRVYLPKVKMCIVAKVYLPRVYHPKVEKVHPEKVNLPRVAKSTPTKVYLPKVAKGTPCQVKVYFPR